MGYWPCSLFGMENEMIQAFKSLFGDNLAHVVKTIDQEHHEIHEGEAFLIVYSVLKDNNESAEIRFKVPNTDKLPHMVIEVEAALSATVELWKQTTKLDAPANRLTPINRNFNSSVTSGLNICHTPGGSETDTADILQYIGSAASSANLRIGGNAGGRDEFILKPSVDYLVKVTSRANGNAISIILDWYEHKAES